MAANKLIFQSAEQARNAITADSLKQIDKLYADWSDELAKRAQYYKNMPTSSSWLQQQNIEQLKAQMDETRKQMVQEISGTIKHSIYITADAVVQANSDWLKSLGFPVTGHESAFVSIPDDAVRRLVTGQIYQGGWNLSSAIWGDSQDTMAKLYELVAQGRAMNMSAGEIASMLSQYVNPSKYKMWNLRMPDGKRIYRKNVEYNSQRLARTLVQHSYQTSFIAAVEKNPFITDVIWRANGSRVCALCMSRDGQHYAKDNVPMDHPNGMCVMEPGVVGNLEDSIANWINAPDGTYPEIDEFAKNFGYMPSGGLSETQQKWLGAAGYGPGQMPKDFTEFAHNLSFDQQTKLLAEAGYDWGEPHPYQKMEKYFKENIMTSGGKVSVKNTVAKNVGVESLGKSKGKTFNYWYTKLDADQKALAKQLKEQSGLTWQQWYEKNIYNGSTKALASSPNAISSLDDINKLLASGDKGYLEAEKFFAKHGIDLNPFLNDDDTLDKEFLSAVFPDYETKLFGSQTAPTPFPSFDELRKTMLKQTEDGMLQMEERAFKNMGEAGRKGLQVYTGSSYTEMNGYLRYLAGGASKQDARDWSGIRDSQLRALKNARNALKDASLEKDLILRRGTDVGDLAGFLPGDFNANYNKLSGMSVAELNARFAGTVGQYAGFTSTSSLYDRGFGGNVEIIFRAPKGTQASSIMSISNFGTSEGETLLNAGTKVKIIKIEASDGHMGSNIRVFMDILV